MTLRGGYELGFALACTSALLIVLLGGELPILAWGAIAAVWFAGRAHMMGRTAPAWVGTAIGLLSLVSGFAIVLSRGTETLVLGATIGIVGLLVGRVMTRTELSHDLQALLLTLLLVFAGAGLNSALSYGLAFVVYAIAAVWALVTRQLVEGAHREAARRGGAAVATTLARTDVVTVTFFAVSGLLSLVILSGTLILFIAFPRVGIGGFGVALQGRRLPDRVSLSSPPRAAMSSQTVARVQGLEYYEYTRGLYLRAATYDRLTRDGFDRNTVSTYQGPREMQGPAELGPVRTYEIFLHPVAGSRLLTLGASDRIAIRSGGKANPSIRTRIRQRASNGDVILDAPLTGAIRYWVEGRVTPASPPGPTDSALTVPEKTLAAWLELPEDIDGRLVSLAKEITSGQASAYDKAVALRRF
ncbi:MAG: transglutaminaseTgpA domain-containing protein, partial [Myxococcota bacterium]